MRCITERDFEKIKKLEQQFYNGVEEYQETLQDTDTFCGPFYKIMEIINNLKESEE
jgi:hypothetical protein